MKIIIFMKIALKCRVCCNPKKILDFFCSLHFLFFEKILDFFCSLRKNSSLHFFCNPIAIPLQSHKLIKIHKIHG